MSNPFLKSYNSSGSSNISVNSIKPNTLGNIKVPLSSLSDVVLTSISDGQVIKYDSSTQKFINGSGGGGSLSTLTDCTIATPLNNQVLQYNSTSSTFNNAKLSHTQIDDIGTVTHANLDLFYNSKGVPNGLSSLGADGKINLSG